MNAYVAEFLGTAILILLGNGVVANVVLEKTKGHGGGWIVITAGWGFAVFVAVASVAEFSGAHLNSAVTIGLVVAGKFAAAQAPGYIAAQLAGALVGAVLVYLFYQDHYDATSDRDLKLATFCTGPNIRNLPRNFFCEALGTFVLMSTVLFFVAPTFQMDNLTTNPKLQVGLGSIGAVQVGLLVFAIGLSLGGTTGYAINPVRDLGPRLAHALLPIKDKRDSDWGYAAIPVLGPIAGAILAAIVFRTLVR
jgi:glycerol uptake facilitator protein